MFSKAPRKGPFSPPADTPGPNAYDPKLDIVSSHKRGAMFDTEARMKHSTGKELAVSSMHTQPLRTSMKENTITVGRGQTSSAAATDKLQDRLSKLEARLEHMTKECATVKNAKEGAETELRLSSQREAKLKASIEKAEAKVSAYKEKLSKVNEDSASSETLKAKFSELVRAHDVSKREKAEEIEGLQRQLDRLRAAEQTTAKTAEERAQNIALLQEQLKEAKALAEREAADLALRWRDASDEAQKHKTALRQSQEQIQSFEQQESRIEADHLRAVQLLETRLDEAQARNCQVAEEKEQLEMRIRQSCDERQTQETQLIAELREENFALTEESSLLQRNLEMVIEFACASAEDLRAAKQESQEARLLQSLSQHETQVMQQHADQQTAQIKQLKSQLRQAEQVNTEFSHLLDQLDSDIRVLLSERAADRDLMWNPEELDKPDFEQATRKWEEERSGLLFTLELTRKESEHSHLQVSRMSALVEHVQSRESANEEVTARQEEELAQLRTEVEEFRKEATGHQQELALLRSERSKFSESLQQLKASTWEERAEGDELREDLQAAKHDLEAARDFAKALEVTLSQAQAMESYLQEQKQDLEEALDSASCYEAAYHALHAETRALISRHALAENEATVLSEINAELLGHTNSNQKIHHMDRVRRELAECKQTLVVSEAEREEATKERDALLEQLSKYRSLEESLMARPAAKMTRVSRLAAHDASSFMAASRMGHSASPRTQSQPRRSFKALRVSIAKAPILLDSNAQPAGQSTLLKRARRSSTRTQARRTIIPYNDADGSPVRDDPTNWKDEEMTVDELGR